MISLLIAMAMCQVVQSERVVEYGNYRSPVFYTNEIWRSGKMDFENARDVYLKLKILETKPEAQVHTGTGLIRSVDRFYWLDCGQWDR